MLKRILAIVALLPVGVIAIAGCKTVGPRVGQKATVQFGVVTGAQEIELTSNAAQGALIGGMLGLATSIGGRQPSATTARNAIAGAAAGGVATGVSEGDRRGMQYTVRLMDGSSTRIVTDQREIREGDCVAVERVGNTGNIRRSPSSYCESENQEAVRSLEDHTSSEAVKCQSAKEELVDATTQEEVDIAKRKIELLCN